MFTNAMLGIIEVDSLTGVVTIVDSTYFNYESDSLIQFIVQVNDSALSDTAWITLNITNVDEAPVFTDAIFSLKENTGNSVSVGTLLSSDPEGNELSFNITSGNESNIFALDASTGEVIIADSSALDYETTPVFVLNVEVSDGSLSSTATVTVNLIDVIENTAPVIEDQVFTIDEDRAKGSVVGTVLATDNEDNELVYSITDGNALKAFAIASSSGEITVGDSNILDFETIPSFMLTVEINDVEETGIADVNSIELSVYPNPASEFIVVDMQDATPLALLEIYNLQGARVLSQSLNNGSRIAVSYLCEGLYVCIVKTNDKTRVCKIVVKW